MGVPMEYFITEAQVKELADLTAANCHTEAYMLGAKLLKRDSLVGRFERILNQHLELGYLPGWLEAERKVAYDEMLTYAFLNMSEADYQRFYMAF